MNPLLVVALFSLVLPTFSNLQARLDHRFVINGVQMLNRETFFNENARKIDLHNAEAEHGRHSYLMAKNKFAHLSTSERKKRFKLRDERGFKSVDLSRNKTMHRTSTPEAFDWRSKNKVTPVIDQGSSGAAYTFAAVAAVESGQAIKSNQLDVLSTEQVDDCIERKDPDLHDVFRYIIEAGGLEKSSDYVSLSGQCNFDAGKISAVVTGYANAKSFDEPGLAENVYENGPYAVELNVDDNMVFYSSGVYNGSGCLTNEPNHAMLVVGYGSENGTDFWVLKNSWGQTWGESGYLRLARNKGNVCGIATNPIIPILSQ